ncbi:MAG: SUMF1/EgtB/PvdO family nonheme iron enzyme, partial [Verrucomicrobiota bacterium]
GVHVLDVSNPTNITWLASVWKIAAEDVALMGNYAVVAGGDKGLAIYQLQQSIYPPLKPAVIAWGMVNMTWPFMEGARLQIATNLAKPFWQDIPESEGTNIVSLPLTEGAAFFRLAMGPKLTDRFVWIPPGTFTMGSPPTEVDRFDSEGPQTAVTISRGFWMGKYEVTQGEYESVRGTNPSWFTGDPNRPVEQVSWQDATAYCDALTQQERAAGRIPRGYDYRLPTEAEWEYACRAGTSTRFSYGDDHGYTNLINYGWWDGNNGGTTHPVGQKLPNPWGLHEMHGNVWEWCQDWWSESLPGGIAVDPQGPATGPGRMGRGGGWDYNAKLCRSAFRAHFGGPGSWFVDVGFRIVLAQGQP